MQDYAFFKCEFIPQKRLWRIVEQFRNDYCHEEKIPMNIESVIESKLNLEIIPERGIMDSGIDAYLKSDYSGIVVDYN